jgi:hypothetical protein
MVEMPAPVVDAPADAVARPPRTWPVLALALATAAGYALFFVLPYYVNHLDRFPLDEVAAGAHDPKDLWPHGTAVGAVGGLGGVLWLVLGPPAIFVVFGWVPVLLVLRRHELGRRGVAVLLLAATVAAVTLAWLGSPFAGALIRWWLD